MSTSQQTISHAELSVQTGLEALRNAPLNDSILLALKYLAPKGYKSIVQFEEDGRKKRSTASVDSWNPDTCEIVIYFEKETSQAASSLPSTPAKSLPSPASSAVLEESSDQHSRVSEEHINECCRALAEAEKAGRNFIALKWFRDDFLNTLSSSWTQTLQARQDILTAAIESGRILTSKLNNPRAPQFPTTTIRLNSEIEIPGVPRRFRPVAVRGEPASLTLLRDRGSI